MLFNTGVAFVTLPLVPVAVLSVPAVRVPGAVGGRAGRVGAGTVGRLLPTARGLLADPGHPDTHLREGLQYAEKAPTRAISLLKAPIKTMLNTKLMPVLCEIRMPTQRS